MLTVSNDFDLFPVHYFMAELVQPMVAQCDFLSVQYQHFGILQRSII